MFWGTFWGGATCTTHVTGSSVISRRANLAEFMDFKLGQLTELLDWTQPQWISGRTSAGGATLDHWTGHKKFDWGRSSSLCRTICAIKTSRSELMGLFPVAPSKVPQVPLLDPWLFTVFETYRPVQAKNKILLCASEMKICRKLKAILKARASHGNVNGLNLCFVTRGLIFNSANCTAMRTGGHYWSE